MDQHLRDRMRDHLILGEEIQDLEATIARNQVALTTLKQRRQTELEEINQAWDDYFLMVFLEHDMTWCTSCQARLKPADAKLVCSVSRCEESFGYGNSSTRVRVSQCLKRLCRTCYVGELERQVPGHHSQGLGIVDSYWVGVPVKHEGRYYCPADTRFQKPLSPLPRRPNTPLLQELIQEWGLVPPLESS